MLLMTAVAADSMTYTEARSQALFLTDKMAYELQLTDSQYDAVYEINLDYFMSLSSSADIGGAYWNYRNTDLGYVLTVAQYNLYRAADYFYRPVYWSSGYRYRIYTRYTDRSKFYYGRPTGYTSYTGSHSRKSNPSASWYKGRTFGGTKMSVAKVRSSSGSKATVVRRGHSVNVTGSSTPRRTTVSKPSTVRRTTTAPRRTTSGSAVKRTTTTSQKSGTFGNGNRSSSANRPSVSSGSGTHNRGTSSSGNTAPSRRLETPR